ncbi:MAG: tetratricopeptide repeat protein [Ramlibacter sp.]
MKDLQRSPVVFHGRGAAAAATLCVALACVSAPGFTPDASAKAPLLEGFGRSDVDVTTRSPLARRLFNQGVLQAYAFDEVEAVRSFKAALAADPDCAMCSWGVAWQLGPTINDTGRSGTAEALKYVDWALGHSKDATARERALLESLALRYAHASRLRETTPLTDARCGAASSDAPDPLDVAYADRMRELADAFPQDPDILSLYAEAEIIATPGPVPWTRDGKPVGRIGELVQRLERLLPSQPSHTGLNHYLVHATDAVAVASRAQAAADRLGQLAPASPHLLHMPAHTYAHVGRYADAVRVNRVAVAADPALAKAQQAQGFAGSKDWRGHNLHFLWYAALMSGQEDQALRAAGELAERIGQGSGSFAGYARSLRLLTLVRFERWPEVLREPAPAGKADVPALWDAWARGIAQARMGKLQDADAAQARVQAIAAALRKPDAGSKDVDATAAAMADFAQAQLQAEIAAAQGDLATAAARQQAALDASVRLDQREPPMLAGSARLGLGRLQARAGQWREAEATFRQALADDPGSGWALRGLASALVGQGRAAEAAAVRAQLEDAWREAAPALRAAGA